MILTYVFINSHVDLLSHFSDPLVVGVSLR